MDFKDRHIRKLLGAALTLAISTVVVMVFWGGALRNPNLTFFAASGDGLKDYFTTTYLVKHDTSYWHSNAMNYPHGENVMFTGSQPSISQLVKLISEHVVDIGDYTVALINLAMILSLVLGSLFLYLLLIHFELSSLYSVLVAVGITFLSPQIARMGGHYSLSYVFAIPFILYLTAKFHERPSIPKSILMAVFMLWAVGTHVYMLGFYAFVVLLFWLSVILVFKNISLKQGLLHFAIQFVVPLAALILVVSLTDRVADRTAYPWGFLYLSARPESILLPIGRPYARFLYHLSDFRYIEWEAYAFVGLTAAVGFMALLVAFTRNMAKGRFLQALWPMRNHPMLNAFLWISIIALLYSFGMPFKLGLQGLVDYIGPLKQMRGIARFAWIFFYVINIYVFYKIWYLQSGILNRYVWYVLVGASLTMLGYDAWYNTQFWSSYLNNSVPSISDTRNELPENRWVDVVDVERYQAILPIPYFHIGSENIWVDNQKGINVSAFTVGWKTGLPSMAVLMSRTSIGQTLENLQLMWEPYRMPEVLSKLNPTKDILVLTKEIDTSIPQPQLNLIRKSTPVYISSDFNLYALNYDSLVSVFTNLYQKELDSFKQRELFEHGGYLTTSAKMDFVVESFAESDSDIGLMDGGSKSQRFRPHRMFYQASVPSVAPNADYVLSFWVHGIHTDLMLRSQLVVEVADSLGKNYYYDATALSKLVKTIDGDWALIEVEVKVESSGDRLGFWLKNWDLRRRNYTVDQVLIRPANTDVYRITEQGLMRNNRFYLRLGECDSIH